MRPPYDCSTKVPEHIEHDPYRCRRPSEVAVTLALEEPSGRTHSYLPYSNHALDISKTRDHALYVEEEMGTKSLLHPPNSTSSHHLGSFITDPTTLNDETAIPATARKGPCSAASLTDFRRYNTRQRSPRKIAAIIILCILLMLGAAATFVCWPRTPQIKLAGQGTVGRARGPEDATDWGPDQQHPWLRTSWLVNVTLNNQDNFIPTRVNRLDVVLADGDTKQPFARSYATDLVLSPRTDTQLTMLFDVEYETPSLKDPTFEHLYNACGPQKISVSAPPALNITLQAVFTLPGIAWKPTVIQDSALDDGFQCPNN
ncbi:predicted protein [Lichtheimia corymbifera JMRC:FSU:9682]|uniref:Uncharacterized protein n=1 Tax=Lichtheimia corymbifera JMRC:FSU:9682 TaxID=1263082 RepID=A0A068RU99_9FUNG|nr:predicted protein [Lichtheimia corymbifera JMRC:FSU:9682]